MRTSLKMKDVPATTRVAAQDLHAGADTAHQIRVRLVTTNAWHALFAQTLFIVPDDEQLLTADH